MLFASNESFLGKKRFGEERDSKAANCASGASILSLTLSAHFREGGNYVVEMHIAHCRIFARVILRNLATKVVCPVNYTIPRAVKRVGKEPSGG